MEGRVWVVVEELLSSIDSKPRYCEFSDREILRVSLWAILHDRPMSWGCRKENWPYTLRPERLPGGSTVSRRWKRPELQMQARALHEAGVRRLGEISRYAVLDGRPLPVGGCTKDPDARAGRSARGMGIGYKMHTLVSLKHVILIYEIRPMNEAEPKVALDMVEQIPEPITRVLGDRSYDSTTLHDRMHTKGKKLYAPVRKQRVGRRQQPRRVQLLRLWKRPIGRRIEQARDTVERAFGQETNLAIGFKSLPAWARRPHRVYRWMWGKNLLHNTWLLIKTKAA